MGGFVCCRIECVCFLPRIPSSRLAWYHLALIIITVFLGDLDVNEYQVEEGKITEDKAEEMLGRVNSNMRDAKGRVDANVHNRGESIHSRRSLIQKKMDSGELTSDIGQQLLDRLDKVRAGSSLSLSLFFLGAKLLTSMAQTVVTIVANVRREQTCTRGCPNAREIVMNTREID